MLDAHARDLAQQAIALHEDPRSHHIFRNDINNAIMQVANEQDTPDLLTVGEVENYREALIDEITDAVGMLQGGHDEI